MSLLTGAWPAYVAFVTAYEHARVPYFNAHVPDLVNALWVSLWLRQHINYRVHWIRHMIVKLVLCLGGTSLAAILMGGAPRWVVDDANFSAVLLGFAMVNWGGAVDGPARFLSLYGVRHFVDVLRGLTIAHAMARGGAERAVTELGHGGTVHIGWHTPILLCFISSCGGGLITEFTNLLLLPRAHFIAVRNGPSPAALAALAGAVFYCVFVRDFGGVAGPASVATLSWVCRNTWVCPVDVSSGVAPLFPLASNVDEGVAYLSLLMVPLACIPWLVNPKTFQDVMTGVSGVGGDFLCVMRLVTLLSYLRYAVKC